MLYITNEKLKFRTHFALKSINFIEKLSIIPVDEFTDIKSVVDENVVVSWRFAWSNGSHGCGH